MQGLSFTARDFLHDPRVCVSQWTLYHEATELMKSKKKTTQTDSLWRRSIRLWIWLESHSYSWCSWCLKPLHVNQTVKFDICIAVSWFWLCRENTLSFMLNCGQSLSVPQYVFDWRLTQFTHNWRTCINFKAKAFGRKQTQRIRLRFCE